MNKTSKNPKQQKVDKSNSLEVLNELESIGKSVSKQILAEAKSIPGEFVDQLFGVNSQAKYSGEISPGEAVEFSEIWDNQQQERKRAGIQIRLERKFLEEERIRVERKTNELKIELKLIQEELLVLAENTQGLAEETQIAAMQSPIEPGLYHVIFFEKLLEFIKENDLKEEVLFTCT